MYDPNEDQEMELCYHQNNGSDEDDAVSSRNLMDFYLYDKPWLQERDPVELIDQEVAQLSEEFPDFNPQMIKNVLLRDDVNRDLQKARQLIEEFRVMREQDQKRLPQYREPRNNEETKSGKRGGNRWMRGGGRGRGRNQHGMMASGNSSGRDVNRTEASKLEDNFVHQSSFNESLNSNASCSRGNFRNQRSGRGRRGNSSGRGRDRWDEGTLEDKFAQQRSSNESLNSNSSSNRGNFSNQRNGRGRRGNYSGRDRDRRDESTLEDKFAQQRSSNESLNSNSSSNRGGNPRNRRNRRGKGWRNNRGRGRGRNEGQFSQEAPGALETTGKEGGLPCNNSRGRMGRAQSFAAFEQSMILQQSQEDEFEPNMLCVRGLSDRTTEEGLTNFIEAKSGDEVLQVVMFGNGKALVVLQNLTDFKRTKQKAEQKQLDGEKLEIRRVEVCQTIHVSGLAQNTTHDALELYFENTKRSGGDTVTQVDYTSGDDEALVHFDSSKVVEKVLVKEHVLNDAKLVVRKFYPDLEEEEKNVEDSPHKPRHSVSQLKNKLFGEKSADDKSRETTTGQQLWINVDPEKMECIRISGERKKLDDTLEEQNCSLRWDSGEKFVVVVYRGKAPEWQHKCSETINSYLERFISRTIDIDGNYSAGVIARLSEVRKAMKDRKIVIEAVHQSEKHCIRLTCETSQAKTCEQEICKVVKVIAKEEEKKTYKSTTIPDIPEENIALLKKIKFFDKLKQKSKDLEVDIDEENGNIHLEGPPDQFKEAAVSTRRQINQIASRTVPVTSNALKVLSSESGLHLVKLELEKNNLDAVFVFDPETKESCVVGRSSVEAEKAVDVIKNMILEQKIKVEKESLPLLMSPGWKKLIKGIPKKVFIHRNEYGDTWVTGFREDVNKAVKEFEVFLDQHTLRREDFISDKLVLRYLNNYKKEELSAIEASLSQFNVKVKPGSDEGNLIISGTKKGLDQVRSQLHSLTTSVVADVHEIKQPGVKRLFTNWSGASLVRSVERDHSCVIEIERKFELDPKRSSASSPEPSMSPEECEDLSSDEGGSVGSGPQTFLTGHAGISVKTGTNHMTITTAEKKTISWKVGDITKEQADVLVASVASSLDLNAGPFARAFRDAAGPQLQQACSAIGNLGTGEVLVTVPGNLPCMHVILAVCCHWDNGSGAAESVLRKLVKKSLEEAHRLQVGSIAFPTLGTGNLKFPWSSAAGVLTDEAIAFSQRHSSSSLRDIRVIVFEKDHKAIKDFQADIGRVQPAQLGGRGATGLSVGRANPGGAQGAVLVEIIQGDITQETTDVIVNVNGTDMNMNSAGAVSKAIARASGSSVEQECSQKGQQPPGAVAMTGAGNLSASCIIHLIPGGGGKDHLEQSVENCLKMADVNGYNSISFPAVGTGNAGGDALQSARSMLRAVSNFSKTSPQNINHIRIVIFQGHMVNIFQQEHQRLGLDTSTRPVPSTLPKPKPRVKSAPLKPMSIRHSACARLHIYAQDKLSVGRIIKSLEKAFADALTKQKVEDEALNFLSEKQVKHLKDKATKLDLDIEIEPRVSRIVVSGNPKDVTEMMSVVWEEINKCKERKKKKELAQLVAKNVQWYYKLNSVSLKIPFDKNSNAEIELALTQKEKIVTLTIGGEQFVIDIANKRGGSASGQLIEIIREMKGTSGEGIDLPSDWTPMASENVSLVSLSPGSAEYQKVETRFRNTGGGGRNIHRIERIQNPMLYRSYIVRKQKMDKENRRTNNELELWHGTASKNVKSINEQGFNRSFCGANGTMYGNGVYFARDASYSMRYASGGQMYLARVLVGEYTNGYQGLIVPPSKHPMSPEILYDSVVDNTGSPSIYVVFFDSQCYPEYLITFR